MKKKSVIKNKSLSKLQNCIQNIFNLSIEKTAYFTEFLDLFLINQNKKSNAIDIILIDELYQILNSVEMLHDDNKINFTKKTIKYHGNEFKYIKKITSGSYGDISSCIFNQKPSILKNIKFKQNELKNDDIVYFLNNEFLKENIIHLILFCLYESMLVCTNNQIPRCIPEIHNVINAVSKNDNGFETIVLIMEKLDYDLCYFFDKKHTFIEELSLISLVVYNIYNLQKCLKNFMHRDFHSKNIMLKKLNVLQSTTIITGDVKFDVYSNYQPYIIDFGMCFINFSSKCKNINMNNSKMVVEGSYKDNDTYNKGQDIRLFLASLYYWHNKTISEELNNFLNELFESYEKNSKLKSQIKNGTPTFFFYDDVLKIKDNRFYPENMLNRIRKILS